MNAIANLLEEISKGACYDSPKHEIPSSFDRNMEFELWNAAKAEHAALVAVIESRCQYHGGASNTLCGYCERERAALANLAAVRKGAQ
jgi:hypothetical protein